MTGPAISPLARPGIAALPRYGGFGDGAGGVDLSDNTNLWGAPPAAVRAIAAHASGVHHYPSMYGEALKEAMGAYCGVAADAVMTGAGSDNVLDATMKAFVGSGDRVAFSAPTFVMVPTFIHWAGGTPVAVPFAPDGDINPEALLSVDAAVTYLCAPNNPTGVAPSAAAVREVLQRARGLVVVDEAYAEFCGTSLVHEAVAHGRLVIARTFSKAFGLAGLRVGVGIAHPSVIAAVERARGPFTLNALAEVGAVAALREDVPWVQARVADALQSREAFAAALRTLGYAPLPSAANFLLVPTPDAVSLAAALKAEGLLVRVFRDLPTIGDALRITAGPWAVMERVLAVFRATV